MEVYCHLPNAKLATASYSNMQHPIILEAITVSVVVNMVTVNGDVVDVQGGPLGQATDDRLGYCIIEGCGTLYIDIFVIIIDNYVKIRKTSINSQTIDLFILI